MKEITKLDYLDHELLVHSHYPRSYFMREKEKSPFVKILNFIYYLFIAALICLLLFSSKIENIGGDHYWIGRWAYWNKNYQTAIQEFSLEIQLYPTNENAYRYRGLSYFYLQDYLNALQDFEKTLRLDSTQVEIMINKAVALKNIGEYQKALKELEKAQIKGGDRIIINQYRLEINQLLQTQE